MTLTEKAQLAQLELKESLATGDAVKISAARDALSAAKLAVAVEARKATKSEAGDDKKHDEPDGDEEPDGDDDAEAECAECEGTGKAECAECEGTGKKAGDADAEAECAECEGTGYDSEAECAECEGSGKAPMDADDDDGDDDDEHTDTKKSLKSITDELLRVTGQKTLTGAIGAVRAMRDGARQVETLNRKVQKMERETRATKVDKLIGAAVREGKIAPAQRAMFRRMGMRDLKELRAYVETAPRVVPTSHLRESDEAVPQAYGTAGTQGAGSFGLTERALHILRKMGVTPEAAIESAKRRGVKVSFPNS